MNPLIKTLLTYQQYKECLRLLTSNKSTNGLNALCDGFWIISVVFLTNWQNYYLKIIIMKIKRLLNVVFTLGATSSNSPFWTLHNTFSVLSPEIPKLTECIKQKLKVQISKWIKFYTYYKYFYLESQILELNKFWIIESPIQITSGSPSLASVMNLWCCNTSRQYLS